MASRYYQFIEIFFPFFNRADIPNELTDLAFAFWTFWYSVVSVSALSAAAALDFRKFANQDHLRVIPEYRPWTLAPRILRKNPIIWILPLGLLLGNLGGEFFISYNSGVIAEYLDGPGPTEIERAFTDTLRLGGGQISFYVIIAGAVLVWAPHCRHILSLGLAGLISGVLFYVIGSAASRWRAIGLDFGGWPQLAYSFSILVGAIFWARRQGKKWFRIEE
ncbi:hypothetical protein HYR69_00870 [Candidatus Sumerlaeota bacterium]|nr:hypothetical protein [Candidatus Sumerlaeota bacterium]